MHYFVLIMGILFVLASIGGFVPIITPSVSDEVPALTISMSYGYLLGLFPINIVHNLIHLGLGIWALTAYASTAKSHRYCQIVSVILLIFAVFGLIPQLSTLFGLAPMFGHDIWLYGVHFTSVQKYGRLKHHGAESDAKCQ